MNPNQNQTNSTFVTVFQLTEILLADKKEDIDQNTIRENIEIAIFGLAESRKAKVEIDIELMISRFCSLYEI